uniref:NADH-ubiquinone oxidoreductase chain 6 n=1 Tax=Phaonia tuguriorum TaxID=253432 RepID=A0A7G7CDL9_9MUSC|nr:NADH dehydrogenase subunit 6 [Phaonia tuguriorum]
MIQWTLMTMLFIFNLIFGNTKHPLMMGFLLLIQTSLICTMCSLMIKSFWFSYILFLVFMGGMLVLFIYVTSLASNEMFSLSTKLIFLSLMVFTLSLIIFFMIEKNFLMIYTNLEMNSIMNMNSYMMENSMNINKLYNYPNNLLTILLMNYLLITLIAVIKITKFHKGPLRPLFN